MSYRLQTSTGTIAFSANGYYTGSNRKILKTLGNYRANPLKTKIITMPSPKGVF